MIYSYQFKNEYYGDEWQDWESYSPYIDDAAKEIAEDWYNQEPCNPDNFEFKIEIRKSDKSSRKFNITAEVNVNFYSSEIDQ